MAVVNPFEGLIQGVLQGHAIATQLKNQAMQEEAYQRAKARDEQDSQLRDIEATQMIRSAGRPVVGNAVQEQLPGMTGSVLTPSIPTVPYARPVDRSRLLTYKTRSGETIQSEAYAPQELMQREIAHTSMLGEATARNAALSDLIKRRADRSYYEGEVARRGVPAPDIVVRAGLARPGEKLLPEDLRTLIPAAQGVVKPTYQVLAPGASLVEEPKPGIDAGFSAPPNGVGGQPNDPGFSAPPAAAGDRDPGFSAGTNPITNPLLAAGDTRRQARQDFINSAKSAGNPAPTPARPGPRVVASAAPLLDTEAKLAFAATDPKGTPESRAHAGAALKRLDQSKRESRPVNNFNMGITGMPTAPTKLTGQAYLDTLPSAVAAQVKAIALGDTKIPPAQSRTLSARQLRDAVFQYDPEYSELLAQQRKDTLKEFTDTQNSKAGGQQLALNTLIHHADLWLDVANSLKNHTWRKGNEIYNRVANAFGAAPPTQANLVARFLAGETGKVATGGVPAEGEINGILKNLGDDAGPDQIAGAGSSILQIAAGRMLPLKERVQKAKLEKYVDILGPDAKAILARRGYDPETLQHSTAGGPPSGGKVSVTDPQGGVHWFADQSAADKFKQLAHIK